MAIRIESQAEPIPGYKLVDRLGGGGFGEVWRAEAPGGLMKAIKFVYGDLLSLGDGKSNRAEQELKALARVKTIRHPYILSLERFDILEGQLLIVMELADRSLWDRFRECRKGGLPGIPRDELLRYMEETAEALDLMNVQYDLQHLDIKPQNLFLVHNHVKVADFGLVKDLEGLAASVTGGVTPVYAAPEAFDGWVSRFSDQYSLGIVFQELLTGVRPFSGGNTRQLILQHLQAEPDLSPLPEADRAVIGRALAKKPPDRHPNCLAFVEALRRADKDARRFTLPDFVDLPDSAQILPTPDSQAFSELVRQGVSTRATPVDVMTSPPLTGGPIDPSGVSVPQSMLCTAASECKPEECGEGVLFPALVIGLGGYGRTVLGMLRQQIQQQFGSLEATPHISFLAIDTDPETAIEPDHVLTVRLNRPSRYLRPRDTMPPLEDWLDTKLIYRIPRSLVTTGVRALGRLAFIEHYRTISGRLRRELECVTTAAALSEAGVRTGLGQRSTWPRVYILTALAGGTGSGMFLDLAYTVQALLREFGYAMPEVVGVFLLPPVDDRSEAALPLANTYAALRELNHFMTPGNRFTAKYEARGPALKGEGAPFSRCILLAHPADSAGSTPQEGVRPACDFLYRDLVTPLGRCADAMRYIPAGEPATVNPSIRSAPIDPVPEAYQSFGLRSLASPRRALTRRTAARLCRTLTEAWASKDVAPITGLVRDHWAATMQEQGLDVSSLRESLQAAAAQAAGMPVDELFQQWLDEARGGSESGLLTPANLQRALQRMQEFFGHVNETTGSWNTAVLPPALREAADALTSDAGDRLVAWAMQFLDLPGYRVAGAEEAVRQSMAAMEERLQQLDVELQQLTADGQTAEQDLQNMLAESEKGLATGRRGELRRAQLSAALAEQLLRLPALRLQRMVTERLTGVHLSMRGRLSDQNKELGFCRHRLRQLHDSLTAADGTAQVEVGTLCQGARYLLCDADSLDDAVTNAVCAIPAEAFEQLDDACQQRLHAELGGLAMIADASGDHLKQAKKVMLEEAERFLEEQLPRSDVAELLLRQMPQADAAPDAMLSMFDEALPELGGARVKAQRERTLFHAPASPAGEQLAAACRTSVSEAEVACLPSQDEVVLYRELVGISLSTLPQAGTAARKAYEMACSLAHFTSHARQDVANWADFPEPV
jgi:serine/threonine protein kinase